MADESGNRALIESAIARARSRWLVSALVNAGGRWAALPAGVAALVGIVLALSGVHTIGWLLTVSALGAVGVVLALLLTRRAYARPAAAGAPDWTLLLDRALNMEDALPTMLESNGEFRVLMESRVAAKLDPVREKLATPARHWGAIIVALILALMPLVFWRPAADDPAETSEVAKVEPTPTPAEGRSQRMPGDAAGDSGGSGKSDAPGPADAGNGGGGKDGEVAKRPDKGKSEGGGGERPDDVQPKAAKNDSQPQEGATGDKPNQPTPPPSQPDEEVESDLNHVKPVAGDGETREEDRSHWVYNPDGDKLDGSTPTPRDVQHPGEKSVPRTKLTTRERRQLEALYKKWYE